MRTTSDFDADQIVEETGSLIGDIRAGTVPRPSTAGT